MDLHIGCCGMPMAREEYFRRFNLVEIQQTFYRPPKQETLAKWRRQAPAGFEFTLKAWQLITHSPQSPTYRRLGREIPPRAQRRYGGFQMTDEVMEAWRATLASARALSGRIIVFQCPPSFEPSTKNVTNLKRFFVAIDEDRCGLILAWEPRGNWPTELVNEIAAKLDLLVVVDPFRSAIPTIGPMHYFRLHGRAARGYNYRYSDDELRQLLGCCRDGDYVLFNNLQMAADAARFSALARAARP